MNKTFPVYTLGFGVSPSPSSDGFSVILLWYGSLFGTFFSATYKIFFSSGDHSNEENSTKINQLIYYTEQLNELVLSE